MTIGALFNQTVTLYPKTSYNKQGREVVGSGTDYAARVQETSKRRLLPNGSQVEIVLVVYMNPEVSVNTDDRLVYNTKNFKVFSKYGAVDGGGNSRMLKLECIEWRASA